MSQLMLHIRPF